MKRLSLLTAVAVSLSLSPVAFSGAVADSSAAPDRHPVRKPPVWFHTADEGHGGDVNPGAFLEFTPAAP